MLRYTITPQAVQYRLSVIITTPHRTRCDNGRSGRSIVARHRCDIGYARSAQYPAGFPPYCRLDVRVHHGYGRLKTRFTHSPHLFHTGVVVLSAYTGDTLCVYGYLSDFVFQGVCPTLVVSHMAAPLRVSAYCHMGDAVLFLTVSAISSVISQRMLLKLVSYHSRGGSPSWL